jgi:hypothetical protein
MSYNALAEEFAAAGLGVRKDAVTNCIPRLLGRLGYDRSFDKKRRHAAGAISRCRRGQIVLFLQGMVGCCAKSGNDTAVADRSATPNMEPPTEVVDKRNFATA